MTAGVYVLHAGDHHVRYVGMSKNIERRLYMHTWGMRNGKDLPVYRWMRKYPNFVMDILEIIDDDKERCSAEVEWISVFREEGHEILNLTDGGEGTTGWIPSEQTKAKISASRIGSPGTFTGKTHTDSSREKMSAAKKGKPSKRKGAIQGPLNSDQKIKQSEGMRRHWSEHGPTQTQTESISRRNRERIWTDDLRAKVGAAWEAGPRRNNHTRWHVNRGIFNPECQYCTESSLLVTCSSRPDTRQGPL